MTPPEKGGMFIGGMVFGALGGCWQAWRRDGNSADIAQYAAVYGILFGLLGLFIGIFLDRLLRG